MTYEDEVRESVIAGIAVEAALMDAQPDVVRRAALWCAAASQMTLHALDGMKATAIGDEIQSLYPDCPVAVARIIGVLAGDAARAMTCLYGEETARERVSGILDGRMHTAGVME